ncbi:hypothetical protein OGAPHI_002285 [Ogataea philodendri]|uniref:Uncharacterized protein n=1 Tax=Ogataea philodendri TaxID=1378263 RepID=A0A9P8PB63_9ASCO|nr:uncharacterized protein OGAPHI_002285 [Ogataea philodendri]KAH3668531.1 hypothetical protein OGAPHI_002285 [Ogataea philodendri]
MWRYLWSRNEVAVNVPRYLGGDKEDSVDLQIKSLMYMFERYKIYSLAPFLKITESGASELEWLSNTEIPLHPDVIINDKLDSVYEIELFRRTLLDDPYRILIDYCKNRFRSYLILSGKPKEFNHLPTLTSPDFQFTILKPNASDKEYVNVLVNKSGIYKEHKISEQTRTEIVKEILTSQRAVTGKSGFDKNDRAKIIKFYVQKLAFHIQVERIYKATLKTKEKSLQPPRLSAPAVNRQRGLRTQRSVANLQSRPLRTSNRNTLRSKPSLSIMKLDNVYSENSHESDSSETLISSSTSETGSEDSGDTLFTVGGPQFDKLFTEEEKTAIYEQSKMAVRIRIDRERTSLTKSHA